MRRGLDRWNYANAYEIRVRLWCLRPVRELRNSHAEATENRRISWTGRSISKQEADGYSHETPTIDEKIALVNVLLVAGSAFESLLRQSRRLNETNLLAIWCVIWK